MVLKKIKNSGLAAVALAMTNFFLEMNLSGGDLLYICLPVLILNIYFLWMFWKTYRNRIVTIGLVATSVYLQLGIIEIYAMKLIWTFKGFAP